MEIKLSAKNVIEDLQGTDPKLKCRAINHLSKLNGTIPPDKYRKEFIPFIINCIDDEDDEELGELSKISQLLLDCVGGKKYIVDLLPIMEILLHTSDPNIRNEVLISFQHYIDSEKDFSEIEKEILEIMYRLINDDDQSHIQSFIAFTSEFFGYFKDKNKAQIFNIYKSYLNEKEGQGKILKIELANAMKNLAKYIQRKEFIELYTTLQKEPIDSVRFKLVESLPYIKGLQNISNYSSFLTSIITEISNDESWRVRLVLAQTLPKILELLPSITKSIDELKASLIKAYTKLLTDKEGEVRSAACKNLDSVAEALSPEEDFVKVLTALKVLKNDSLNYVRNSLATHLLSIAPLIGSEKTNEYIFPIFLELIKDEDHDIRMVLVKNLDKLHEVINIDSFVQGIIPSLVEISNNSNWRIRNQIAETIPVLANIVNKKIFLDSIMTIIVKWLTDPVYAIRQTPCKMMRRLYVIFRGEEFEKKLLTKLSQMVKSDSYLIRITVVKLIQEFLVDEYDLDFLEKKLFAYIVKLSKDKIPNVRQNCSVFLKKLIKVTKNKDVLKESKSLIDELKRDKDLEVVYALTDN